MAVIRLSFRGEPTLEELGYEEFPEDELHPANFRFAQATKRLEEWRQQNLIIQAFDSDAPILDDPKNDERGEGPFAIACAVGRKNRAGVLYLEVSEDLLQDKNQVPLTLFKAVHKSLVDCLKLR